MLLWESGLLFAPARCNKSLKYWPHTSAFQFPNWDFGKFKLPLPGEERQSKQSHPGWQVELNQVAVGEEEALDGKSLPTRNERTKTALGWESPCQNTLKATEQRPKTLCQQKLRNCPLWNRSMIRQAWTPHMHIFPRVHGHPCTHTPSRPPYTLHQDPRKLRYDKMNSVSLFNYEKEAWMIWSLN